MGVILLTLVESAQAGPRALAAEDGSLSLAAGVDLLRLELAAGPDLTTAVHLAVEDGAGSIEVRAVAFFGVDGMEGLPLVWDGEGSGVTAWLGRPLLPGEMGEVSVSLGRATGEGAMVRLLQLNQPPPGRLLEPGEQAFQVFALAQMEDFPDPGWEPLPAGFFDPGSEPFLPPPDWWYGASVGGAGSPEATPDLVVRRTDVALLMPDGIAEVGVEVTALNLQGRTLIEVSYGGDRPTELWSAEMGLDPDQPPAAGRLVLGTGPCGDEGTVRGRLQILPRLRFIRVADGAVRTWQPGADFVLEWTLNRAHWVWPQELTSLGLAATSGAPVDAGIGFAWGWRGDRCLPECDPFLLQIRPEALLLGRDGVGMGLHPWLPEVEVSDDDADGVPSLVDNAVDHYNPFQEDRDDDGVGDLADNAPDVGNPCQEDVDGDGVGDEAQLPPLGVVVAADGVEVSWLDDPDRGLTLQRTTDLEPGAWEVIAREPTLAGDRLSVTVPGEGPRGFYAGVQAKCDCKALSILAFDYETKFEADKKRTNTTVKILFTVTGTLTCATGKRSDVCEGYVNWEMVGRAEFEDQNGKALKSETGNATGTAVFRANCKGKPVEIEIEPSRKDCQKDEVPTEIKNCLRFDATVESVGRIKSREISFKFRPSCPSGDSGESRTIKIVLDSESKGPPKGIDNDASDLDGDGLSGEEEQKLKTDTLKPDTDGDGTDDGK